jgi:two-component system alkaline phosphatase synthesis response regulator PhoP
MPQHTGPRRILVVDDQPDIRLMCRVNLALEGYEIIEAPDGESALATVYAQKPDLVLLDVMMPGVDGWEVLRSLKEAQATAHIPVVLLTARVQREDEIQGWKLGASDYLPKPFNPSTLSEVVRRALTHPDHERRKLALEKLTIL